MVLRRVLNKKSMFIVDRKYIAGFANFEDEDDDDDDSDFGC